MILECRGNSGFGPVGCAAKIGWLNQVFILYEQIAGQPLSARSDQFALGTTLVELLTGTCPYDGNGVLNTMEAIKSAPTPSLAPPSLRGN